MRLTWGGVPRIVLFNAEVDSGWALHFACVESSDRSLYIKEDFASPQTPTREGELPQLITHVIDGRPEVVREWVPSLYHPDSRSLYASRFIKEIFVESMLQGAAILELIVEGKTITFNVLGFVEAAKPVLEYCGQ